MPSFNKINYNLRPSKSIQRQIVFAGIDKAMRHLDLDNLLYVGFGSVWFTDFVLAHKTLGIRDMISIEGDDVGYRRAVFNIPYATVRVVHGYSNSVLPKLFSERGLRQRPWMIWLDYDYQLNESVREDMRLVVENAPQNSIILLTFNGREMKYGKAADRPDAIKQLLGSVVPDDLSKDDCKNDRLLETLADLSLDYLVSIAGDMSRPGGFVPAFRLIYQDGAPMVTVGGFLPARGAAAVTTDMISSPNWPAKPPVPIRAPQLTLREAAVLQAHLPSEVELSRDLVQELGFDLEEEELRAFQTYYLEYPSFAQIVA